MCSIQRQLRILWLRFSGGYDLPIVIINRLQLLGSNTSSVVTLHRQLRIIGSYDSLVVRNVGWSELQRGSSRCGEMLVRCSDGLVLYQIISCLTSGRIIIKCHTLAQQIFIRSLLTMNRKRFELSFSFLISNFISCFLLVS